MDELISVEEFERLRAETPRIKLMWRRLKYRFLGLVDFSYHFRRIRWFIQRGKRGYADCDYWEMSAYLTSIILPMLRMMKKGGYPGYGEASTPEKWDALLDEMIKGFEAAERIDTADYMTPKDFDVDVKLFEKKMKVFARWYFQLWD